MPVERNQPSMDALLSPFRQHIHDIFEGLLGFGIFTLGFWHRFLTDATDVAQIITIFCGATVGLHSIWRIFIRPLVSKNRHRRRFDE